MLRTCSRLLFLAVLGLFAALLPCSATAQSFTVVDLGVLSGGTQSQATAISQQSHVVGESGSSTTHHAFFFNGSSLTDLGTLGGTNSIANGINAVDESVGQADTSSAHHAFLFSGSMVDLGTLGGTNSIANAINGGGQIAGQADTSSASHAFLWTPAAANGTSGTMLDLGTLGGTNSEAFAITDSAQVGGQSDITGGAAHHAFIWDNINGMQDLGTLGGSNSVTLGLNGSGQAVGQADTGSASHAFLFDSGAMLDLGTLGGTNSVANAINTNGFVVGQSDLGGSGQHAFLYDSSDGLVDLNTEISSNSGWVLVSATGIDDKGEIVGFGTIGGHTHAFLLRPILASVFLDPKVVYGGAQSSTGTVTLNAPAGAGGVTVSLSSSNGNAGFRNNNDNTSSSITVPQGAISATFIIDTGIVGANTNATISATFGTTTESDVLTIKPLLEGLTLDPATVVGGVQQSTVTVILNATPPSNVTVNLASDSGLAGFQNNNNNTTSSVVVPAGSKTATVIIDTGGVATNTPVHITASLVGLAFKKTLTLTPLLKGLTLDPTSVVGGAQQSTGTVTLNAPAGSGGVTVNLSSSSGLVGFQNNNNNTTSSVTVPQGSTSASFILDTGAVKANTVVNITATLAGATSTQPLTLKPLFKGLSINPTIVVGGCQQSTGTVTLNAPAPSGGVTISLASNNGNVGFNNNNDNTTSSITVPQGATSAPFILDTAVVGAQTVVTITATQAGLKKTAKLTLNPALVSVSVNPSTVIGGCEQSTGTVTLAAPALNNITVNLSSSDGHVGFNNNNDNTTSSIVIPAGSTSATFILDTGFVGANLKVTITATLAGLSQTASLTLKPALLSVSVSPNSVVGGCQQATGTVTLAAPPLSAVSISLSSSDGHVGFNNNNDNTSSSIVVPAGSTSATFILDTGLVGSNLNVTITASLAGLNRSTVLTLTPALQSLTLNPSTVKGGGQSTGTVTLAAPALSNITVNLSSSDGHAGFQNNNNNTTSSIVIPAGATSATFIIDTSTVTSNLNVTISASLAGLTLNQTLTLTP